MAYREKYKPYILKIQGTCFKICALYFCAFQMLDNQHGFSGSFSLVLFARKRLGTRFAGCVIFV